ncbi:MAG TPA: alpha/beta hydrolase-fold protein [Azospirillaceae bacterium]|nr:alpha/beta hydrolase-fold protein [Azospirillaceae bacterium]
MPARLAALLLAAFLITQPASAEQIGTLVKHEAFPSAHVEPHNVTVWLPPGYEGGTERYSVLYMADGQNVFEDATSFIKKEWGVDEAVAGLMAEGKMRPTIVVGVRNTANRRGEYFPRAAFDRLPEEVRTIMLPRFAGKPPVSDDYLRFLVEEVKPFIDKTYRTRPDREDTMVMGASAGGMISLYAVMRHPDGFGGAGCLSTH